MSSIAKNLEVDKNFPWLGRDGEGGPDRGFIAVDPEGRMLGQSGHVPSRWRPLAVVGCFIGGTVLALLVVVVLSSSGVRGIVLPVVLFGGVAVAIAVAALLEAELKRRDAIKNSVSAPSLRITDVKSRSWRLCQIMVDLAACTSWAGGALDPDRKVVTLFWEALQRSILLESDKRDVGQAKKFGSLEGLAEEVSTRIRREERALDAVTRNLELVLENALAFDQRRERHERDLAMGRQRANEERELRSRLLRAAGKLDVEGSESQVDRSSGLAVEVAIVANLLDESDRFLAPSV